MSILIQICPQVTEEQLKNIFSESENSFSECWKILAEAQSGKKSKPILAKLLLNFQPRLIKTLYKTEEFYNKICQEERWLIRNKPGFLLKDFEQRMKELNGYKYLIDELIDIGKTIGDAFAWIFYQKEKQLLRGHYQHEFIPRIATGIGGRGEVEFISRLQKFGNYYVLSHSITTFLRQGDCSLIDPSTLNVVAIGELKTELKNDSKMSINIYFVGGKHLKAPLFPVRSDKASVRSKTAPPKLPAQMAERLKRQIRAIKKSFTPDVCKIDPVRLQVDSVMDKITELFTKSSLKAWGCVKAGRSLLLVGLRFDRQSLYLQMTTALSDDFQKNVEFNMQAVTTVLMQIVDKTMSDNSIRIQWLIQPSSQRYELQQGVKPVFWWPLNSEIREALVFKRLRVMSMFNPAHLISDLRSRGLTVETTRSEGITVSKKYDGVEYRLVGVHYFLEMIQRQLFSDESVANTIQSTIENIENKVKHPATVNLVFDFKFD